MADWDQKFSSQVFLIICLFVCVFYYSHLLTLSQQFKTLILQLFKSQYCQKESFKLNIDPNSFPFQTSNSETLWFCDVKELLPLSQLNNFFKPASSLASWICYAYAYEKFSSLRLDFKKLLPSIIKLIQEPIVTARLFLRTKHL